MTAGELAAVLVSIAGIVGATVLVLGVVHANRTLRALRAAVEDLRDATLPAVDELRRAVAATNAELTRVDGLLDTAESVTASVDSASRLAQRAVANPVIKAAALATGTAKAARSLRR